MSFISEPSCGSCGTSWCRVWDFVRHGYGRGWCLGRLNRERVNRWEPVARSPFLGRAGRLVDPARNVSAHVEPELAALREHVVDLPRFCVLPNRPGAKTKGLLGLASGHERLPVLIL